MARIKLKKVSADTGEEVPDEHIVKGYEISKGRYVVDPEPLGTGGAIKFAAGPDVKEPVVVFNGDVLTEIELAAVIQLHRERQAHIPKPDHGRGEIDRGAEQADTVDSTLSAPGYLLAA